MSDRPNYISWYRHYRYLVGRLQLAGWLLALAACGSPPNLPPLAADATVLAFGDSLTAGTGASAGQGYPAHLQAAIGRRVINAGIPGETSAQGHARLTDALDEHRPDLVLLCLGGNDFLQRLPAQYIKTNLTAMLEQLDRRAIPVLLIAVPKLTLLGGPHSLYGELGERFGIPVLDDALNDVLRDSSLKADRVHPNGQGYARIADAIEALLRRSGALRPGA